MILAIEIRLDSHMFPRIYAYRLCIRLAVLLAIDPYLPPCLSKIVENFCFQNCVSHPILQWYIPWDEYNYFFLPLAFLEIDSLDKQKCQTLFPRNDIGSSKRKRNQKTMRRRRMKKKQEPPPNIVPLTRSIPWARNYR